MSKQRTNLRRRTLPESRTGFAGIRIGCLVGWDVLPLVDFSGNSLGPLPVRTLAAFDEARTRRAMAEQREVVLAFDGDRVDAPILLGLLQPLAPDASPVSVEAIVDGKRVELKGEQEVVLQCGQASITLRANGRVVIRGAYVETRSTGVNRVKGGTVLIN